MTTVRHAAPHDLPAIGRLAALLVKMHYDLDPKRFIAATSDTAEGYSEFLGSQLEEPDAIVLVAETDGEVVGYLYASIEGHDWISLRGPAAVMHDIVVDPSHRGHGAGQELLDAALVELAALGAPRAVLLTAEQNESAQRMFERAGFRRTMVEMTRELE